MKLAEAKFHVDRLAWYKFIQIFSEVDLQDIIINKGKTGQILEKFLGMKLSNTTLDFEDGELKTNKCNLRGESQETIAITQIGSRIDDFLLDPPIPFAQTHLYEKISNVLYVFVCKEGEPPDWFFFPSVHVNLSNPKFQNLRDVLTSDYFCICKQLRQQVESGDTLHTASGKFLQIRTKDSEPYHPIYSNLFQRIVSNKNRAFYFKREFMSCLNV